MTLKKAIRLSAASIAAGRAAGAIGLMVGFRSLWFASCLLAVLFLEAPRLQAQAAESSNRVPQLNGVRGYVELPAHAFEVLEEMTNSIAGFLSQTVTDAGLQSRVSKLRSEWREMMPTNTVAGARTNVFHLGRTVWESPPHWTPRLKGKMDETRIWKVARTEGPGPILEQV